MAHSLIGKHCAIVGATGTIGTSIAKAFASKGAVLSLLGRSALDVRPRLEPLLDPPHKDSAGKHRFIKLDVSSPEAIQAAFGAKAQSEHAVGPVDILVNCAGIAQTTILKRTPDAELGDVINTNLTATMLACKHARMQDKGCIINVSSIMAHKPAAGAAAYAAAKAGVIGLTSALCLEMATRSIRVNALLPGWVESPMWHNLRPSLKDKYLQSTPVRRVATPDEVADAAVFLASNGFANNCILNLDGGLSAA